MACPRGSAVLLLSLVVVFGIGCGGGSGGSAVPGAFALLSPADEATEVSRTPVLSWQASTAATSYSLVLGTDPTFASGVVSVWSGLATTALVEPLAAETEFHWRVVALGPGGRTTCTADFSFASSLFAPPVVVRQPVGGTAPLGGTVTLSVQVTGAEPIELQWYRFNGASWEAVSGATGSTLQLGPLTAGDDGARFRCSAVNPDGQETSTEAVLTVRPVWFVSELASAGGDGTSWGTAFTGVQAALAAASSGDDIWAAQGTYVPGAAQEDTFLMKTGVELYGGFSGVESLREERDPSAYETILSGDIGTTGNVADNSFHVVTSVASGGVLDGFTIAGGCAAMADSPEGGGLRLQASTMTVRRCVVRDSLALSGGGLYCLQGSPRIERTVFVNNTANNAGGAFAMACAALFDSCLFYGNTGAISAATSVAYNPAATYRRCTFAYNSASEGVGAVASYQTNTPVVNCVVWGNTGPNSPTFEITPNGTFQVEYCCVEGGWTGTGNVSSDPAFVAAGEPAGADGIWATDDDGLRLGAASPCQDAGDATRTPSTDLLGQALANGPVEDSGTGTAPLPDMGCYEYQPEP